MIKVRRRRRLRPRARVGCGGQRAEEAELRLCDLRGGAVLGEDLREREREANEPDHTDGQAEWVTWTPRGARRLPLPAGILEGRPGLTFFTATFSPVAASRAL